MPGGEGGVEDEGRIGVRKVSSWATRLSIEPSVRVIRSLRPAILLAFYIFIFCSLYAPKKKQMPIYNPLVKTVENRIVRKK